MFKNLASSSLFTLSFPKKPELNFKFKSATYADYLSAAPRLEFHLEARDNVSPQDLMDQTCELSWDWNGKPQYFQGQVTALTFKPSGLQGTDLILICESPLIALKRVQQSRHFIYKNLQTIVKEVIDEHGPIFQELSFHLGGADPERPYTEQHQETDLSFLERILHEVGWFYRLEHTQAGVNCHVYDQSALCPLLPKVIDYQPLDQGTKTNESIFELSHEQESSDLMIGRSDCLGLRSGQVFQLQGHPVQGLNQTYLIRSVIHEINENQQGLRYQNLIHLLPTTQAFKPKYSEPNRRINTMGLARIHSESEAPHLTEKGEYLFRSPHTGELTHPVRLTTPYAGQDYGFHFPLHENTQVLVAYLNGHPDQPVLLGSIFNEEHPNVVTSENARQNLWITQSGHTLLMDDHPGMQKILLHTPQQTQRFLLDASQDLEKIELVSETGQFQAKISKCTSIQTEADLSLSAGQSIKMVAANDCLFTSEKANIQSEAAQDLSHHAGQDMKLHSEKDLNIRVDGQSQTTVIGAMRTEIKSGNYDLQVAAGTLSHQAQGSLQYTTATGNIVLKTANASASFNADGTMVFSAKKIILQAEVIDVHNAGQGMGN